MSKQFRIIVDQTVATHRNCWEIAGYKFSEELFEKRKDETGRIDFLCARCKKKVVSIQEEV